MTAGERAVRCLVTGRVQDVWYRASTAQRAQRLALRGWAKNLPDGRVEVVLAGRAEGIAALCGWLWEGPPGARVSGVTVEEWTAPVAAGFQTL